jgi:DNA-binding response OmpR family regulator
LKGEEEMFEERLSPTARRAPRVLVADDDPVIRLMLTSALKAEGCTPVVVGDGREAYRLLRTDADFEAAIFDIQMPHLEGVDIIRHMSTERRLMRIPVMLISSEPRIRPTGDGFAAGATVFLPKPFTAGQLRLMLRMLLDKSERAAAHTRGGQRVPERPAKCGQK